MSISLKRSVWALIAAPSRTEQLSAISSIASFSHQRHFSFLCDADADIDSNAALSHAPAASQGFGAVPVGFSAGCPVATLRPCLLPSSAPSDDGDDGDGLSGIPHPDN